MKSKKSSAIKAIQPAPKPKKRPSSKKYVSAVGRRKSAVARVRLYSGSGETLVNGKPITEYFSGEISKVAYLKPFVVTNTLGKYYATVKVEGSGKESQLDAFVHGLSRALDKENKKLHHHFLKEHGLLTRDSRERERRKPGLGGKARRRKQSPKR